MRKASYFATFSMVALIFTLNILSSRRVDWLVVKSEVLNTKFTVTYGLTQQCELTVREFPSPSGEGKIYYRNYQCTKFPNDTNGWCDHENNKGFCTAWTSAGYFDQISFGFAGIALVAMLFGITTHSRRRRIWRAVAGLILLAASFQIATFAIITSLYDDNSYPTFNYAKPGLGYVLHTICWISNIFVVIGVITAGLSADAGHRWAAGNRAYQPISN